MSTPKNYENERYWTWVRENFPGEQEQVKELWRQLESLRFQIFDIEQKLLKYAPPLKNNNEETE